MSQPLAETAIEVRAETKPFEEDLDRTGRRTRRRKTQVPVEADTAQMLRDIDRALESLRGREVEVDADTRDMLSQLDRALDGYSGDVNLDPEIARLVTEIDRALAAAQFEVPVEPKILPLRDAKGRFLPVGRQLGEGASAGFNLAFGGRILAVLGGLAGGIVKGFAPVAKIFFGAAAGAVALGGALQLVAGAVGALAPVAGLGLAVLPAYLATRAVAVNAFKLAVLGLGDAMAAAAEGDAAAFDEALEKLSPAAREAATAFRDAVDELRPLQQALQESTFAGVADRVRILGRDLQSLDPYLRGLGSQFNAVINEALRFAAGDAAIGAVMDTTLGLQRALDGVLPAIRPVLEAFANLVSQGSQFAGPIGQAIGDLGQRFAAFISTVDLRQVFDNALPTLQALGALLSNIGQIFGAVFAAADTAGTGLFGTLAAITGQLAVFLNSAQGLAGLSALMGAAGQVAAALGQALGAVLPALGQGLGAVVPAIAPLAGVLAAVLSAVAPLLPPLGALVGVLGTALVQAITPLVPVVQALATLLTGSLGAAAPVLAQVGATIASVLAPAAQLLATLFAQLAPYIVQLGAALGSALAPLLVQIGPLFATLLSALMPLIPAIVSLLPAVISLVGVLAPLIEILAQLLVATVTIVAPILRLAAALIALLASEAVVPLINLIAQALTAILGPVASAAAAIAEFAGWLTGIDWAGVGAAIGGAFTAAWNAVVAAVTGIVTFVMSLPGRIVAALAALPGLVVGVFQRLGSLVLTAVGVAIGLVLYAFTVLPGQIGRAINALPGIVSRVFTRALQLARTAAVNGFNAVVSFASSVPGRISSGLSRLTSIISGAFTRALTGARNAARNGFNSIVSLVQSIPGRIAGLAGRFVSAGSRLVSGLVSGLRNVPSLGSIGSAIAGVIRRQANNIIGAINRGISSVDAVLPGSLPRVPTFAQGVIADKPTLGVFGEAGREVIIPLSRPTRARELAQDSGLDRILGSNPDGQPIYVTVRAYIGDQEITRMIDLRVDRRLDGVAAQVDAGVRVF